MTVAPQPSVARTLIKTLALVTVTGALMASLRFSAAVAGWVDRIAGTRLWSSLYSLAGASDALSRERLILMGVAVACFLLALPIVQAGEWCVDRVRDRRS
ncbi:hypothetical protein HLH34_11065 [Gluconacetobacter azotocaptans]|uniref:Uncharacterized protein n=1 Tax=Gluconacetobacter azotocaptans TaxID=142834 RepID=A0A7W4JT94_9PROT|nr:hypothetical protein [Gluconacetobacter azotocaptans]MBB2190496.1 hypothetical protein [Gluconacetobacter azotocaptans]MBM9402332.1 hypothetical protein [Gluconacetobacter azotocaptans]GBQ29388.1 hypothetical protein AA13594_1335 [Gluconacetobacter azotocaptans DSM 13594]